MNRKINETSLKNVIKLALPIAMQQLLIASLHMVDTAFIVRLGNISTAAIGAAGSCFFFINLVCFGLCSGMMVLSSQFWGIGDKKTIHNAFGLGLINSTGFGIIVSVLGVIFPEQFIMIFSNDLVVIAEGAKYLQIACLMIIPFAIGTTYAYLLRATENVMVPLIVSFFTVGVNTGLNYILIFGKLGFAPMGIRGAAIATVISSVLQCMLYILISKAQKNIASSSLKELIPRDKEFIKKFYRVTIPILGNEVFWAAGVSVYKMVFGRQGEANLAAYTIYTPFDFIAFTFFIGICSACGVIIGKLVGRGEKKRAYDFAKKFIIYSVLFAAFIGSIVFAFAPNLISLMKPEDEYTAQTAVNLLKIFAVCFPMYMVSYVTIVGAFRSAGSTKIGMLLDLVTVWFIGVPFVAVFGLVLDVRFEYIFAIMYTEHLVKSVICFIGFKKYPWIKSLTGVVKAEQEV